MGDGYARAIRMAESFNRDAEARGWPMRVDADLAFAAVSTRSALAVWREKAACRRMPSRGDMTPRALKTFLTEVVLLDVVREATRVRFRGRLTGTDVARFYGQGAGGFVDESAPYPACERWPALMMLALDIGGPVRITGRVDFRQQTYLVSEVLMAPLGVNPEIPDAIFIVANTAPANQGKQGGAWKTASASVI